MVCTFIDGHHHGATALLVVQEAVITGSEICIESSIGDHWYAEKDIVGTCGQLSAASGDSSRAIRA